MLNLSKLIWIGMPKNEAQLELVPGFRSFGNMHKDGKRLAIATGKSREGIETRF